MFFFNTFIYADYMLALTASFRHKPVNTVMRYQDSFIDSFFVTTYIQRKTHSPKRKHYQTVYSAERHKGQITETEGGNSTTLLY